MKLLLGVLLAVTTIGGSSPPFVRESWADSLHGWATDGTVVYGTENGGRSWHRLLRANEQVDDLQRTSTRAGFVNASLHSFITIDAGRHWYFAAGTGTIGQGHLVYWADSGINQLLNWPPRRLRCRTGWIGEPNTFAPTPKPHNVCDTPTVVHLRSKRVYVLPAADPNDQIFLSTLVPGGVAGFVFTDCGEFCSELVRVVVYRNGSAIVRTLPPPAFTFTGTLTLTAAWPVLVVTGPSGYWISGDGGNSWRFV